MILPESCAIDGVPQRGHGQRFDLVARWHAWVAPSRALVLDRVRVLREAAATARYRAALDSGLSDYEARAEGWPS